MRPFSYEDLSPEKRANYKATLFELQNSEGIDPHRARIIRKLDDADNIRYAKAKQVSNIIDIKAPKRTQCCWGVEWRCKDCYLLD